MKKVTIMIPTYNQSQYIEQCIDSALAQDYSNLEVIISDDSTNNETEKIVKEKYLSDSRVQYYHNIPALGRVDNYHKTLYERASGDYVLNLDGDDWLIDNRYISEAVNILCNDDSLVCVFAKIKYYDEFNNNMKYNSSINKFLPIKMSGEDFYYMYVFYDNVSVNHLTLLYNRQKAMEVGFYEENIIFSDGYSFAKLINNNNLAYIDKYCGVWRNHGNNASLESSTEHLNMNENINFENLLAHVNLITKYYNGLTFEKIKYTKWAMSYKINTLYPHIASIIKNKKYKYLLSFFKTLKKYDKTLVFPLIIVSIKNILKFLFKVLIRKIKSSSWWYTSKIYKI